MVHVWTSAAQSLDEGRLGCQGSAQTQLGKFLGGPLREQAFCDEESCSVHCRLGCLPCWGLPGLSLLLPAPGSSVPEQQACSGSLSPVAPEWLSFHFPSSARTGALSLEGKVAERPLGRPFPAPEGQPGGRQDSRLTVGRRGSGIDGCPRPAPSCTISSTSLGGRGRAVLRCTDAVEEPGQQGRPGGPRRSCSCSGRPGREGRWPLPGPAGCFLTCAWNWRAGAGAGGREGSSVARPALGPSGCSGVSGLGGRGLCGVPKGERGMSWHSIKHSGGPS